MLGPKLTAAAEGLVGTSNNTTASYATLGILDVARIGGTPANAGASWKPEPSTLAGVALHTEIYDFGRLELQADALDAFARAADESARAARLDLELFVEESFYAVLGAKAVLAASEAATTRARTHRELANAKVTAKLWSPIELTRADADLARYEVDRVRALGALATARSALAAAIGSDAAAVDAGTDDVTIAEPAGAGTTTPEGPELRAAKLALAAQQQLTRSIRRELSPDLSVSAELTGRAGGAAVSTNPTPTGAGWIPDVPNWDALVVLSWPLYDPSVTARAKVSQRAEAVRAAEVAEISQTWSAAARQTAVALGVARDALPALQRAVDAAAANHEQAEGRFAAGLGTAIELSDAEALLVDAQIQLAVGQFQLSRARARLARAVAEEVSSK
jgi:outer membrane protein TolC